MARPKAVAPTYYKRAAERLIPVGHHPSPVQGKAITRSREPARGAWVQVWVWVPEEMAQLEKTL